MRETDLVDRILSYNPKVDTRIIKKAFHFGMLMHGAQLRESGDPYFSHPIEVANILAELNLDTSSLVCALLHDTIEDTDTTAGEIEIEFGSRVRGIVEELTDNKLLSYAERKQLQIPNQNTLI